MAAGSTEPELPPTTVAAAEPQQIAEFQSTQPEFSPPSARDVALKAAGDLIAGTFDSLTWIEGSDDAAPSEAEVTAVAVVESAVPEASGAREVETTPPLALAKRTVTSVPVGDDGQPEWPLSARSEPETVSAAAGAAREVASVDNPAVEPLAFAAAPATVAPAPLERPETLVPEPTRGSQAKALADEGVRIGGSAVNVRSGPGASYGRLFVFSAGAKVEATHAYKGWVRVLDSEDRAGWVYSDYLVNVDTASLPAPEKEDIQVAVAAEAPAAAGDVRTVKGQGVNVRSGPSSSNGKLFALKGGTKVTVSDENRGWLRITDPQGRTGWVYQQFLSGG